MIAEICLIFGWTPDYALNMPVRLFFAMLKNGREQKQSERDYFFADMVDVASVPNYTGDYHKELRNYYIHRSNPKSKLVTGSTLDACDPETGALVLSIFRQKKRLEGLDG